MAPVSTSTFAPALAQKWYASCSPQARRWISGVEPQLAHRQVCQPPTTTRRQPFSRTTRLIVGHESLCNRCRYAASVCRSCLPCSCRHPWTDTAVWPRCAHWLQLGPFWCVANIVRSVSRFLQMSGKGWSSADSAAATKALLEKYRQQSSSATWQSCCGHQQATMRASMKAAAHQALQRSSSGSSSRSSGTR